MTTSKGSTSYPHHHEFGGASHPCRRRHDLAILQANQEILCRVEQREAFNPFRFFERLFR